MQKGKYPCLPRVCLSVSNKDLPAMHVSLHQPNSRKERASTIYQIPWFPLVWMRRSWLVRDVVSQKPIHQRVAFSAPCWQGNVQLSGENPAESMLEIANHPF